MSNILSNKTSGTVQERIQMVWTPLCFQRLFFSQLCIFFLIVQPFLVKFLEPCPIVLGINFFIFSKYFHILIYKRVVHVKWNYYKSTISFLAVWPCSQSKTLLHIENKKASGKVFLEGGAARPTPWQRRQCPSLPPWNRRTRPVEIPRTAPKYM